MSYQVSINNELKQVLLHAGLRNGRHSGWLYTQEAVNFAKNKMSYNLSSHDTRTDLSFGTQFLGGRAFGVAPTDAHKSRYLP
jgi:hypothetical protein